MLASDELPEIGLHLLSSASPSSAALAGATAADGPRDLSDLFDSALAELGLELPTKLEAAEFLKRIVAREALSGTLSPRAAAEEIRLIYDVIESELPRERSLGAAFGVENIIGLYYSYDDVAEPADVLRIDRDILDALAEIAAHPDPA